jgi:hypothetical protein
MFSSLRVLLILDETRTVAHVLQPIEVISPAAVPERRSEALVSILPGEVKLCLKRGWLYVVLHALQFSCVDVHELLECGAFSHQPADSGFAFFVGVHWAVSEFAAVITMFHALENVDQVGCGVLAREGVI